MPLTLEQIKKMITPEMEQRAREAMSREPDLTDPDAPEITDEMFARATRPGRKNPDDKKVGVYVRLSKDVYSALKSTGKNFTTRIDNVMRHDLVSAGLL